MALIEQKPDIAEIVLTAKPVAAARSARHMIVRNILGNDDVLGFFDPEPGLLIIMCDVLPDIDVVDLA